MVALVSVIIEAETTEITGGVLSASPHPAQPASNAARMTMIDITATFLMISI
jgi:hypothetical protein